MKINTQHRNSTSAAAAAAAAFSLFVVFAMCSLFSFLEVFIREFMCFRISPFNFSVSALLVLLKHCDCSFLFPKLKK